MRRKQPAPGVETAHGVSRRARLPGGGRAAAVAFLLIDKFVLQNGPTPEIAATEKSVAVLPFVAMSSGPDDEYFADGLTEEILNSLTRLPELPWPPISPIDWPLKDW